MPGCGTDFRPECLLSSTLAFVIQIVEKASSLAVRGTQPSLPGTLRLVGLEVCPATRPRLQGFNARTLSRGILFPDPWDALRSPSLRAQRSLTTLSTASPPDLHLSGHEFFDLRPPTVALELFPSSEFTNFCIASSCCSMDSTSLNWVRQRSRLWSGRWMRK